ncbi:MAG: hypothetical protein GC160_24850 [Acidobacteria bacterium]|nr:hypothetical protein [Acidobacteriota bacterium]
MRAFWTGAAALFGLLAAPAAGQPFVFYRGVVNAASFAAPGLPSGALARGSIFSVFGKNLGPAGGASVSEFPLQTTLAGVGVEVCRDGACAAALPLYVGAGQINAVLPSDAPLGAASVRVTVDGAASNWAPVEVTAASFGAFAVNSGGFGPGIVQNFVSQTEQPLNSKAESLRPGQAATLWGTGLGAALNADNVAPEPGNLPTPVEVHVGGAKVSRLLYAGRSPCCAGVDQIVFEVPADAPEGCYVPLSVTAGGVVGNVTTVAVSAEGGACSEEGPLSSLAGGGRTALLALSKLRFAPSASAGLGAEAQLDYANALFLETPSGPWSYNRLYALPPVGACQVHGFGGNVLRPGALARQLQAAGDLTPMATVGAGAVAVALDAARGAAAALGRLVGVAPDAFPTDAPFYQEGGSYPVSTSDPAVSGEATVPAGLTWTNRDEAATVPRGRDLTIRWSGATRDRVYVVGFSADEPRGASAIFVCAADAAAGQWSVPARVLSALPASSKIDGQSWGGLMVGEVFPQGALSAEGIAAGALLSAGAEGREASFQ